MPQFDLSILAIVLGLLFAIPHAYGIANPAAFGEMARKFPRFTPAGYVLMIAATLWFLANVRQETVSDFASFKPMLLGLFALVGVGACPVWLVPICCTALENQYVCSRHGGSLGAAFAPFSSKLMVPIWRTSAQHGSGQPINLLWLIG